MRLTYSGSWSLFRGCRVIPLLNDALLQISKNIIPVAVHIQVSDLERGTFSELVGEVPAEIREFWLRSHLRVRLTSWSVG